MPGVLSGRNMNLSCRRDRNDETASSYEEMQMNMNSEARADSNALGMPQGGRTSKSRSVREVFEDAPRYLKSRRVDMMMRTEAVHSFASGIKRQDFMDIGCGDASISLPLLTSGSRLTLLDLSSNMLARAKQNAPETIVKNIVFRNEDFKDAIFEPGSFDLIVTVGVVAHVDSPDEFLRKIKTLLRPGGHAILEFTDAYHFVGRIDRFFGWLKERIAPRKYSTNRLSASQVFQLIERHKFRLLVDFRYARLPIPGVHRIISADLLGRGVRAVFGRSTRNRNAWLGNEHICFLRAEG
jgi:2-polyprenyl-3-methyl-5-hydroxy-6-metoxy-1,4-benzoquinol methylase